MTTATKGPGYVLLTDTRASFFYGFNTFVNPKAKAGDYPRYVSHFLLQPTHPDLAKVAAAIETVGLAKWKEQWPMVKEQLKGQDKLCLHKGDISKAGKTEYAGMFYVSGSGPNLGKTRFNCFHPDGVTQAVEGDGLLYSGVRCNAILDIWAQDNPAGGKRINATITGVQHLAHAPAFTSGARAAAPGEFGNVSGADAPTPAAAGSSDPLASLVG